MSCGTCSADVSQVRSLGSASSPATPQSAGAASAAGLAAVEGALASHVSDRTDPHRTLDLVPGTLLGHVDPTSVEGYLPGTRYVNLDTRTEYIVADVGSGLTWVQVSAGGWSASELQAALAGYTPVEAMDGYVSRPEMATALEGYVPLAAVDLMITDSEARGYAESALADAKEYADAAGQALRSFAETAAAERAGAVAAQVQEQYASKTEVAGYARASDVEGLISHYVRTDGTGPGTPISDILAPYATSSELSGMASRAELAELRRQTVYLRDESDSYPYTYPVPGHSLQGILAGYVTPQWLTAHQYMDSAAVSTWVNSYLTTLWWPGQRSYLVSLIDSTIVRDGVITPESFNAASSAAVAAYVSNMMRTATWNYLSYRAALDGLMPGGVLMPPQDVDLESEESEIGLTLSTATTAWVEVPAGRNVVSVDVSVFRPGGRENPGTESPSGWSEFDDEVSNFEFPPSRDAVVVLEFASGWSPTPASRLRFPAATAVYGADSDALSLASCSAGDVVAVAVHELKEGVYMVSRRPMVAQAEFQ